MEFIHSESTIMQQSIRPARTIFHTGDTVTLRLDGIPADRAGTAVVRTNIGRAAIRRAEIVARTDQHRALAGLDWHDLPMKAVAPGVAELTLPFTEIGIFEAKCCFLPADRSAILWPEGENFRFKVCSANAAAGNTIYSAFVRQFGANMDKAVSAPDPEELAELDRRGYTVIPPSGTFRALKKQLDHIFNKLGCRILQLLPIHPAPTQYGRMGRYGSPFASLDYFNVDPALADFDPKATPLEQFGELVDAVHARNGRIFLDIPVNHTGWASKLQGEHPDYFVRKADGAFESPGAWGVVWADLCKLDYTDPKVHQLMAKVFLFWCRRHVDGFRCDAGYMLPEAAWNYIVARVREEFPDTVFLLEGLGGPLKVQERLLGYSGLTWGYSELFQNYTRDQISRYFPYVDQCSALYGTLVNFAETHDNMRLAASGRVYARLRFLVAALLAENGAFGFANGAEFFATEKIDVHGAGALNWGASPNLIEVIRKLTLLNADHPAFLAGSHVELIQKGGGNVLAARRTAADGKTRVLVLLNLDCDRAAAVHWPVADCPGEGTDLLSGRRITFRHEFNELNYELAPGEGLCIDFTDYRLPDPVPGREPAPVERQRADAMARSILVALGGLEAGGATAEPGKAMLADPVAFAAASSGIDPAPVTRYRVESDPHRRVMLPPGDVLLVKGHSRFRVEIRHGDRNLRLAASLPSADGRHHLAMIALPSNHLTSMISLSIRLTVFESEEKIVKSSGELVQLPQPDRCRIRLENGAVEHPLGDLYAFAANRFGGISYFSAAWGRLTSKYEAILAANINRSYPVDRHVMFTRCRAWLVVNGYSRSIELDNLIAFNAQPDNRARWLFALPAGQGCRAILEIEMEGAFNTDAVRFHFRRHCSCDRPGELPDSTPAKLILRPDLEDRINHQVTKAFAGPEQRFPAAVRAFENGFDFTPAERRLALRAEGGSFHSQPEWYYMVDLPSERYYGLEDKTDLFSPGYFEYHLEGGQTATLTAFADAADRPIPAGIEWPEQREYPSSTGPDELFEPAMRRFVVKRDEFSTVIAGYPWFLDWGRDTLIALRGLVAGNFRPEAEAIIRQFALFERNGTIPNMIRGLDDANRDTSDAPLYLIVATRDYVDAAGSAAILDADCGGRTLRNVLVSIVENYRRGTPNGIVMDSDSALIFSPSHFTWMDTNFPAGTPREGYPVEIQALWFAALDFLGREEPEYRKLSRRVAASIERYFFQLPGRCSDCLHARRGVPARAAVPDDHIRPNQLLAVTLGAVTDPAKCRLILTNSEELLVPGGIRSLADRPVACRLPVERNGVLLNDPEHPYRGRYCGPEDTSRKVAYHNGTVWSWPFPAYCEALYRLGGEPVRKRALAILMSAAGYFETGVIGQLPEVADGDAPHRQGGCPVQAWSGSEFFRVYELLKRSL